MKSSNIGSLTSLRFIAASMIVYFHSHEFFGMLLGIPAGIPLHHGVSFFYVLSGFILTHVYSDLNSSKQKWKFIFARFARIWPAHLATFVFLVVFLPTTGSIGKAAMNLAMLHAWIPYPEWFFSYNSPSWSISNEFFFYICFPFLINRWNQTWGIKLLLVMSLLSCIIVGVEFFDLPPMMLSVNPIVRLPEFFIGIGFAKLWKIYSNKVTYGLATGTLIEALAVVVTILSFYFWPVFSKHSLALIGTAGSHWFSEFSSAPAFALLICVFALERGILSRSLRWKILILLGEISYSIYLIHHLLLRYIVFRFPSLYLDKQEHMAVYIIYLLLTIMLSYLSWKFVEKPGRKYILRVLSRFI